MNFNILKAELLLPAYTGMTDVQAADSLNVKNVATERAIVQGYEVVNCIEPAAMTALVSISLQQLTCITSASGGVDIKNVNVRNILKSIFPALPANTATRAALAALQNGPLISRAAQLDLSEIMPGHVAQARAMA